MEINNQNLGIVKIADEVIMRCAAAAALKTEGVYAVAGGITEAVLKHRPKENLKKAVKMAMDGDEITFDIYVTVDYAQHIPDVAYNIQKNVKAEVEKLIGHDVKAVNIRVQGIHFPEGETEDDQN